MSQINLINVVYFSLKKMGLYVIVIIPIIIIMTVLLFFVFVVQNQGSLLGLVNLTEEHREPHSQSDVCRGNLV